MGDQSSASASDMRDISAKDIGEIKGLLQGVKELMASNDIALNRRIDDMHNSNTRRLDDLQRQVTVRLDDQGSRISAAQKAADNAMTRANEAHEKIEGLRGENRKSSVVAGGGAAGVVAVAVEFIKRMFQ